MSRMVPSIAARMLRIFLAPWRETRPAWDTLLQRLGNFRYRRRGRMFKKILIANRGAIACRILRTLRRMGIGSVAVYSDADRYSQHVALADESVYLGASPASESYLRQDLIIAAALARGAQAIHPGYGFLSENAQFASACEAAGVSFIGPTPAQMRDFGPKHQARAIARAHAVPLLPGSELLTDLAHACTEAQRIGYPVMLKSTAGGGG